MLSIDSEIAIKEVTEAQRGYDWYLEVGVERI